MLNEKDKWSALSMKERADLIKLYVSNGITSINDIKKDYNSFAPGGPIETDEYGYPADITPAVVTQDEEFNKFLMTLPDNQRLTPEEDYHTYQYWKINGKPKDFSEALDLGMYHYDSSDNSYHANSVAFDNKGVGYFMKPKHHPTVKYELDWFNKGVGTLEGGKQYPLQGEERKEWEDFRNQYQLDSTGVDYKYVPRKHYNSFGDGGKKSKIVTAEMTPSQAIKYNESADNASFMIPYGGTPDNPEFLYPEELEASAVVASAKEAERKALEKEVAKLNSSDAWKYIGLRQGENLEANKHAREYVEPLVNAAIGGIGGTLLATNPFTTELAIDALQGTGHATHVMLDPLAANTMFGAFLGTASQAAGITAGIYNASNTIDKWRSGNFNWYDIPYFALDAASTIPVVNTVAGLADDAARMVNNTYKTQRAAKNATKPMTNRDPGLAQDYINAAGNAMEPVQVDPRVAKIYNQQITGKLSSKYPSKLTPDESSGIPKEIRNRKNKVSDEIFGFSTKQRELKDVGNINKREILDKIKEGYYVSPYKLEEHMIDNILGRYGIQVYDLHNDFGINFAPQTMKSADDILKFASSLDDIPMSSRIAGLQIDDSGITPSLINLYRRYLNKLGYDNSAITDEQLSRLLQYNYNQMVSTQRGAGKGTILFHGEGKIQPSETFNLFTDVGKNLDNLGRSGPGMYFSTQPGYSYHNNGYNIQPYLINNIDDIVTATSLGYSGSLPISGKGNVRDYFTYYQKMAKDLGISPEEFKKGIINATTGERNLLVADFFENNASGAIYGYPLHGLDFRYRGPSQNIKSVFPHPDRFVRQSDGTVILKPTDWNDPRFNFKNGGKLLTKRK